MLRNFTLLFVLITGLSFSQDLYVANDSYLYTRDVALFVNDDIRLETPTSNIYLRGDGQLLQNTDTKNSDAGELSIYQNQTTGIYEYNYWCSPVGISIDGIAQGNVSFQGDNSIHDPTDHTDLANVASTAYSFTSSQNGTATELSNFWIYTLVNGEGYFDWNYVSENNPVAPGLGFTLKGSPNTNNVLDFRGRPNNGTITVSCTFDGSDDEPIVGIPDRAETLTGNPYPSALDLKKFIIENTNTADGGTSTNPTNIEAEIYFWEQKPKNSHVLTNYEGGYSIYTPGDLSDLNDNGSYATAAFVSYAGDGSSNLPTPGGGNTTSYSGNNSRRYAAVGQGFVVSSKGSGGNFVFTNSMRLYLPEDSSLTGDGSVFAKNGKSKKDSKKEVKPMSHNGVDYKSILENPTIIPEIKIHTRINDTYYKENVIAFRSSTPNNNTLNRFFDGINIHALNSDAYLLSENKELSIKSINYDEATRIPFGLKAEYDNMLFSVRVYAAKDTPSDVNIYVYDNTNNTYTDVKNGTFNITLETGTYNNRFEITFSNKTLNVIDNTFDNFDVIQNNTISQLKILNPNALDIKSFNLFDVSGKQVLNENISGNKNTYAYSTKPLSNGVYIARISLSNNQVLTKKVIVSNKN
ncbi:T9SS type A sorting domain-containing protein [Sabulilitoribacter arenilitoris]|uniref:T9SS type A sorting domain-containing protein n=1 Tax=Wocania arenilitoris TaxID=2044858 RepID=A0AAE3ESI6_9FLAO|nr:T9SS type A sorting domain-containing protein [Wocania arenilitoris]MCF7569310.1 T9SS type A sorting domain-containing protein [Wocania arenilitoris]